MGITRKVFYQIKTHMETNPRLLALTLVGKWSDGFSGCCPVIELGQVRELKHSTAEWRGGGQALNHLTLVQMPCMQGHRFPTAQAPLDVFPPCRAALTPQDLLKLPPPK